ncbi:cobalamin B12-binding domain-containing protein [Streptomyces poonensis]|uniref:Cobalamin-binding protein n=1 Tax=Streptomyces poonensis TaxID=68255 RepID=A0A918PDA9_9ACTN|nr:cobalamin-dependent protein [Streptomyces poonensis]GGY99617.1 cobalamin-binding protein [Streptomyces poonensis]GLJ92221.1 cobalamin-binding protein [Streptomyces poonensis]
MTASGNATAGLRDRLWEAVLDGDAYTAADVLHAGLDDGHDRETLLLDVIGEVQAKVGVEWAADRITVAQEHAATAVNERVIATLTPRGPAGPGAGRTGRGRVTVACVDGEWHALPARLVAEVLQLRGWQVDYLGAQTPVPHLIAHLHRTDPYAVLLSSSVPTRLPAAHAAITACQAVGVPVMVGGRAFGPDGRYARAFGADRWAADARAAAAALETGFTAPDATAARQAVDDLPHLTDQEYTMVVQSRPQLVKQTLVDMEERFPALRRYTEAQRERTAEDLAHIVDFLATALYVDDAGLFTDFLTWTAGILEARRVPARSLLVGLDLLGGQLHDFPRATALLHAGTAAVTARPVRSAPDPEITTE